MVTVTFVDPDGRSTTLDGAAGQSLMEVGRRAGIAGILATCGGCCACATCQVLVDPAWIDRVDPPSLEEADMLEFAAGRGPASRLSCQIRLHQEIDGLSVHVPGA